MAQPYFRIQGISTILPYPANGNETLYATVASYVASNGFIWRDQVDDNARIRQFQLGWEDLTATQLEPIILAWRTLQNATVPRPYVFYNVDGLGHDVYVDAQSVNFTWKGYTGRTGAVYATLYTASMIFRGLELPFV